jgi:hypothetical protein
MALAIMPALCCIWSQAIRNYHPLNHGRGEQEFIGALNKFERSRSWV